MRYAAWILAAYVVTMFGVVAVLQDLSRARPVYHHALVSVSGPFELVMDRYAWLPFGLNGHGRAPGEVSVLNGRGTVVDSERIGNVLSIQNVRWEQFAVHFDYKQDGKIYESTLALEP